MKPKLFKQHLIITPDDMDDPSVRESVRALESALKRCKTTRNDITGGKSNDLRSMQQRGGRKPEPRD